jgi:hypothetical protein
MSAPHPIDLAAKLSWELDLDEWEALPDADRAWYRENVTKGQNFGAVNK